MDWLEFVRALRELAGSRQPIHFVMAHDETLVLIERTGHLILDEGDASEQNVTFYIDRPSDGKGGGFALRDADLSDVRCITSKTGTPGLRIVMRRGYPIFTLTQT